jgi:hypothetical protein
MPGRGGQRYDRSDSEPPVQGSSLYRDGDNGGITGSSGCEDDQICGEVSPKNAKWATRLFYGCRVSIKQACP